MKKLKPYRLLLLFCMIACSKKNDPSFNNDWRSSTGIVIPKVGSASGSVKPAGAVKSLTLLRIGTSTSYTYYPDNSTGLFDLRDIPEGNYLATFAVDPRYLPIASFNTAIIADKETTLGTFSTVPAAFRMSYEINGIFEGWQFKANYAAGNLIIGPSSTTTYPEDMRTVYYPSIQLNVPLIPGTYFCQGSSKSKITYSEVRLGNGARISYLSTEHAGGSGSVIITSIDTDTRTIKGTFQAKLTSVSGSAAETKVITNGTINTTY